MVGPAVVDALLIIIYYCLSLLSFKSLRSSYIYVNSQLFGNDLYEAYGAFYAHCNLITCYAIVDCLCMFIFMK